MGKVWFVVVVVVVVVMMMAALSNSSRFAWMVVLVVSFDLVQ